MGTTRDDGSQQSMWVSTADLPRGGGHPFFDRLNRILDAAGFDPFVVGLCAPFYARMGRPGLAPGRYFRLLLIGYFEGLDSERAIAWRTADSLSLRSFLRLAPPASPPDHSTISRTRPLLSVEVHQAVFNWVLQQLADAGLFRGKTVGIDATTLEANAALRSIVRRDTGEDYTAFLTRLAEASGIETPTRAELARFDRSRKKKTSNAEWKHPHDPDARVAKMQGRACGGPGERCDRGGVETGGMRRVHLRGHPNILKRVLVQVAGCNLGLLLRHLIGVGTPRSLQGRAVGLLCALLGRLRDLWSSLKRFLESFPRVSSPPATL